MENVRDQGEKINENKNKNKNKQILFLKKRYSYNTGSPPPATSQNDVLKFLSHNNMVIPAVKTGNENNNKKAVMNNRGQRIQKFSEENSS